MQGIFISYRRQDSQSAAGRLADHLKDNMHGVPIFRDVETIEPGVDFVEAIGHALQSCGILLAVIGPRWVCATSPGRRDRTFRRFLQHLRGRHAPAVLFSALRVCTAACRLTPCRACGR